MTKFSKQYPPHTHSSILDIGPYPGVLEAIIKNIFNVKFETLDINQYSNPDHVGSVVEMPFADNQYDVVCCCQVLEHLPYENFHKALSELFRVANKGVIISLPNSRYPLRLYIKKSIEKIKEKQLSKWASQSYKHINDLKQGNVSQGHHWEINLKGYKHKMILNKLIEVSEQYGFILEKEYRVWENPYFHNFIFKSINP